MESITIISKLFEMYSAKISALESMLKESNPTMYKTYSDKLEEVKQKNAEQLMQISNGMATASHN